MQVLRHNARLICVCWAPLLWLWRMRHIIIAVVCSLEAGRWRPSPQPIFSNDVWRWSKRCVTQQGPLCNSCFLSTGCVFITWWQKVTRRQNTGCSLSKSRSIVEIRHRARFLIAQIWLMPVLRAEKPDQCSALETWLRQCHVYQH